MTTGAPTNPPSFIEQARRRQIVDNAIQVLAARGYAQASIGTIAAAARISKGVITYHFASKDELMRAVVDDVYRQGAEHMAPETLTRDTPTATLEALIRSNLAYIHAHRAQMVAVTEVLLNHRRADGTPHYDVSSEEPTLQATELLFVWGQRTGDFRSFDPRVMALSLRRAIDGAAAQLVARPDLDLTHYADELVALFDHATRRHA